jgi:tRNA (cytidine/uridine-2'-O-)-methyltransferase
MLHVALLEPEIPPNTGNVARLCAATGSRLHLIGRLGFRLDDRSLRRAGIDYWDAVDIVRHVTFEEFERVFINPTPNPLPEAERGLQTPPSLEGKGVGGLGLLPPRLWLVETPSDRPYTRAAFADGDCLLFGGESKGLPPAARAKYAETLVGIPMPTGKVRSLNLATAVGVVLYEALRQVHEW